MAWSGLFYYLLGSVGTALLKTVFAWVPHGFTATTAADAASFAGYARPALLLTFAALVVLNGVAAPIVEELYFRGYLLPRLARFGGKAPLLEALLFTVYHFWQPWLYPLILVTNAGLIFPVYRTRNLYIGMWAHCLLNLLGGLATAALVLNGTS